MASHPRILQLADIIAISVAKIQETLTAKNLPSPSFDENAAPTLPLELSDAQDAVLGATSELQDLLMEPMLSIHGHGEHNNSLCQQAICHFGIAAMVPAGGRLSFAEIAKQTPLTEQMVRRPLRHAMTMHIFCEPEPGFVAHTKASKILADPVHNDWLRTGTEEMWPASTKSAVLHSMFVCQPLELKAQLPALKTGGRVIIQDVILPEPEVEPRWKEKSARNISGDLSLAACFNARDRTVTDWKTLLLEVQPSFALKSTVEPKGSALGILEFVWGG